jgi:arsenate reductase
MDKPCVLFLCAHNSARSQMAEALLRKLAGDRYTACSAGLEPTEVHPMTMRVLEEAGVDTTGLRAKSVAEVLGKITVRTAVVVCRQAAGEACPRLYPFTRDVLQWPFEDPARIEGTEESRLAAFRRTRDAIESRLRSWLTPLQPWDCPDTDGSVAP